MKPNITNNLVSGTKATSYKNDFRLLNIAHVSKGLDPSDETSVKLVTSECLGFDHTSCGVC